MTWKCSTLDGWAWANLTIVASTRASPPDTGTGCAVFYPYACAIPLTSQISRRRYFCAYCASQVFR
jgi:hypothetical protein